MQTITLSVDFDKIESTDFLKFLFEVYQIVLALGREIVKQVLEAMDTRLMESRDKGRYRNKGKRETTLKTILGDITFSRRVYVDAAAAESKQCVYLLDNWMNVDKIGLVTGDMCKLIATAVCETSYRAAAKMISKCTGLSISHTKAWDIVQKLGEKQKKQIERHTELMKEDQSVGKIDTPILFEEDDGIWLALQGKSRKEYGPSKEMKLGIAYDGVTWSPCAGGKKRRTLNNKVAYGSFESAKFFRQHKEALLRSRFNTDNVILRVSNGDGANWIHNHLQPNTIAVLDKFHRNKKITECVRDPEFAALLRKLLYAGKIDTMLACIEGQINSVTDEKDKELLTMLHRYYNENKDALLGYYDRGIEIPATREPGKLHHARLGSMESNVFTLAGNRMKDRRCCWSINGANNLIALLCMYHTSGFESLFDVVKPPVIEEPEEDLFTYRYRDIPFREGKGYEFWANSSLTYASPWFKGFVKALRDD